MYYIHKDMAREEKTISGYVRYLEENRLNFQGREILCIVGVGVVDNSCCGVGGCLFIEVPGYVVSWKSGVDQKGHTISLIDPISAAEEKEKILKILRELYPHAQVRFGT